MSLGARNEFSEADKAFIRARQNHRCIDCRKKISSKEGRVDHIVPDALCGTNDVTNGVFRCLECDGKKTYGNPAVPLSGDVSKVAKLKRVATAEISHHMAMMMKRCGAPRPRRGTIRNRGFEKRRSLK